MYENLQRNGCETLAIRVAWDILNTNGTQSRNMNGRKLTPICMRPVASDRQGIHWPEVITIM